MTLRTGYFKKYVIALKFYNSIPKKERAKYKLINENFIVKYIDKNKSVLIADFHKAKSVFNETNINAVQLNKNDFKQIFDKKNKTYLNSLGFWLPLRIAFKESSINHILD